MSQLLSSPRVIVALDYPTIAQARALVSQLDSTLCRLKIGNILFTQYGPAFVEELMKMGFSVFLDLKFHDIPQTVAGACRSAAALGVWMVNVHIQGGHAMLEAACHELAKVSASQKPLLIGVTVLTSLVDSDLQSMGLQETVSTLVPRMAALAQATGLDGVVCSAQEVSALRGQLNKEFVLVTPGIRLHAGDQTDQKRIMSPEAAINAGASYLVVGRPITQADQPLRVLQEINAKIR